MKRLLQKRAFTLIETLLAICIFAAIALPLMSVFLQSTKTDRAARNVLNANYITQDYIETLDTKLYKDALQSVPTLLLTNQYYLTATIKPYGNAKSLFSTGCAYLHLIMRSDGSMLAVLPDGKWRLFSTPTSITVSVSNSQYSLNCSGTIITGPVGSANCAVIVNAMKKKTGVSPIITLGTTCKAIIYCTTANKGEMTFVGTTQYNCDLITAATSLVHVTASVYESQSATKPLSIADAYINLRNE